MSMQRANAHWVVWMSLLIASILAIVPLPSELSVARPAWAALVVIYWVLALPERFGMIFSFVAGIILDILTSTPFGLHSLALISITAIVLSLQRRLRIFPWFQQICTVLLIMICYQLIILWGRSAVGHAIPSLWQLLPAITSALLWPFIAHILRFVRCTCRVV
ncbi:Rod shape-determining protein MreD [invertebrate metagenome]|uniref:Rod shape-determining protein MreD n=1 Tax=invertebrate metagenome TaxID=1711999 RepID=A0A2H9T9R7_9ZZZZ